MGQDSSIPQVRVILTQALADHAGGVAEHRLSGATVGEVLHALALRHPAMATWLWDTHGNFNSMLAVFVNRENMGDREGLATVLRPGDELMVITALEGG